MERVDPKGGQILMRGERGVRTSLFYFPFPKSDSLTTVVESRTAAI